MANNNSRIKSVLNNSLSLDLSFVPLFFHYFHPWKTSAYLIDVLLQFIQFCCSPSRTVKCFMAEENEKYQICGTMQIPLMLYFKNSLWYLKLNLVLYLHFGSSFFPPLACQWTTFDSYWEGGTLLNEYYLRETVEMCLFLPQAMN